MEIEYLNVYADNVWVQWSAVYELQKTKFMSFLVQW